MGLPVARLGIATNANDILARFWRSGAYKKVDSSAGATADGASDGRQAVGGVRETLSPAMDILVSSNFERLLWYLAYEAQEGARSVQAACATLDEWMRTVKSAGRVQVPHGALRRFCSRSARAQKAGSVGYLGDARLGRRDGGKPPATSKRIAFAAAISPCWSRYRPRPSPLLRSLASLAAPSRMPLARPPTIAAAASSVPCRGCRCAPLPSARVEHPPSSATVHAPPRTLARKLSHAAVRTRRRMNGSCVHSPALALPRARG
ncbi:hypothetical protein WOLCODRAFT_167467 [Wolfiporia cocos MD-104 SS10]|uniref:Uncharacterized protein n=1 Tax=Wolfiporia cocos (strain MD-104) TaxID=742152 RepID=A0A2H3JN28_WOLCO|nr:hypothetical protein WOLCODRAFT_167467 [Wolfiporia cocos MD-104 SS10]